MLNTYMYLMLEIIYKKKIFHGEFWAYIVPLGKSVFKVFFRWDLKTKG